MFITGFFIQLSFYLGVKINRFTYLRPDGIYQYQFPPELQAMFAFLEKIYNACLNFYGLEYCYLS